MKNRLVILTMFIMMVGILSGCCLEHEWKPATCTEPMTCVKCGETEGEALGHSWMVGNCSIPRTCTVCGETEGEAPGHTWLKANCVNPQTCAVCGAVQGDLAEHTWIEATCIMPRHCSVCGVTEGYTAAHKWIDANYDMPRTCAVCGTTEGSPLTTYSSGNISGQQFSYSLTSGAEQDYTTITGYDNRIAHGNVKVLSYNKYTSDATHPYKEGYEWREVKVMFSMDKPCRVMWGYADTYTGLSEYARTDYITYSDGTREHVNATQSFSSTEVLPSPGGATPTPTPTPEPTPTQAASSSPSQAASATGGVAPIPTAPQIPTPTPTPTPTPIPDQPGRYVSYVTQAVQVPTRYDALMFYVCNADYEIDHVVDDTFHYMKMD